MGMTLTQFVRRLPRAERGAYIRQLAEAHDRSPETVRTWLRPSRVGRPSAHPAGDDAMRITEAFTGGRVSRYDERPDIYGKRPRKRA